MLGGTRAVETQPAGITQGRHNNTTTEYFRFSLPDRKEKKGHIPYLKTGPKDLAKHRRLLRL